MATATAHLDRVLPAVDRLTERFAALVTSAPDPAALLLVFYRRQSQWPHVARGRLLAWGRRPWLALTLAGRFLEP